MSLREQWRVIFLVVLLLGSAVALFAPQGTISGGSQNEALATDDGPTNLEYGLELAGGTRIRAPVHGVTAEDVQLSNGTSESEIQKAVAGNIANAEQSDVMIRQSQEGITVEVLTNNVTVNQLESALDEAGIEHGTVRDGVTQQTRDEIVRTLQDKISESGLAGGRVQEVTSSGDHFIQIEMPNTNQSEMNDLVTERGKVTVVAHYPTGNGSYNNTTVLTQDSFTSIGQAEQDPGSDSAFVSVSLNDQSAERFVRVMNERGFTSSQGIGACNYANSGAPESEGGYCLYTVVDGDVVYGANMGSDLAPSIRNGEFQQQPTFRMLTTNMSDARQLQINLRAGALPAALDTQAGTTTYLAPSLATEFKMYSLVAGIAAVLAVSGTVFLRYGKPKVALPMIVTALSEVVILLGIAAAIELPLDLSHIAGFIAVIGTGVDDLIIIADEVMSEGNVHSSRVFQSRFRKAFWVIGAAAATTIIAMSPLAVLSLGDLQGFAIITILGVLIGVLITRPAYGDILRYLLTNK
ncbi:preprotein translocase subunit SecD [Haladaptatus litoreus]|uniref:Protein-export membrane protein SecD n=1 Tax=Haladaptatus litoreus TaxID=553468 RepID=A0A1N6ZVQ1_9EURY|nr:preprotein translocase subunit SecD [Haladaptatus litoreus]SIR30893.1 preprotein translocase subunit SecD [Haladaptatus litoreus]